MKKTLPAFLFTALLAAAPPALHAAPNDNERGTSVYDQNPDCMDRAQSNNPKCTINNGPPHGRVVGATQSKGGTTAPGTGSGTGSGSSTGGTGTKSPGSAAEKAPPTR